MRTAIGRAAAATHSVLYEGIEMNLLRWVQSLLTRRGHALADYRSGMKKANKRDYLGAIADYSAAIDADGTPEDVRAMAIYNRALAYSAMDEGEKAARDLDTVLKMPRLSAKVQAAAQQRRERLRKRSERAEEGGR